MSDPTNEYNSLGQPIGFAVPDWTSPPVPPHEPMVGRYCRVVPLDPAVHATDLYAANALDNDNRSYTYLFDGPFESRESYTAWLETKARDSDQLFHAIVSASSGEAVGIASYLRITPAHGTIEVGNIHFSPLLQRTPAATEAMYLMMKRAFDLGYRRYEWKCNALNAPSRAAAQRLGFSFEGIFRQAVVVKGRNRDTAWYAAIDSEWPALESAFLQWLDPANFDDNGRQRVRLSDLTGPILKRRG
jgi:RimJ/RimL family protein N-acetyltransferase